MKRRSALAAVGASVTAVAGCLGIVDSEPANTAGGDAASRETASADEGGDDTGSDDGKTTATGPETTEADDGGSDESAESATAVEDVRAWRKPSGIVQVGSSDDSHRVALKAESGVSLETPMEIRIRGGETIYEGEISVSAENSQTIRFEAPHDYLIVLPETAYPPIEVRESNVDCNWSSQRVTFEADGALDENISSTLAGCDIDLSDLE